jgi:hypothetical protein
MNLRTDMPDWTRAWLMTLASLAMVLCITLPAQAGEDPKFVAVEKDGVKVWEGGGTVELKPGAKSLTLKAVNKLNAEHGFAIDTMKVKEVLKPGEEKTITVPFENIDRTVTEHRVYCHLHPKHGPATLKVKAK